MKNEITLPFLFVW